MIFKMIKIGAIAAVVVLALVWPAAWFLESQSQTLQPIEPKDDELTQVARFEYEEEPSGDPEEVIGIYGSKLGDPVAFVFPDQSRIVRPAEMPKLALLQVYKKDRGENPLQLKSVFTFAKLTSFGAGAAAVLLFLLLFVLKRRRAAAPDAA